MPLPQGCSGTLRFSCVVSVVRQACVSGVGFALVVRWVVRPWRPGSLALRVCMCALVLFHCVCVAAVGARRPLKNSGSHIDASHSRQPLVKGERLVRYEVNAVMPRCALQLLCHYGFAHGVCLLRHLGPHLCYLNSSVRQRAGVVVIGAIAISLSVAVLG